MKKPKPLMCGTTTRQEAEANQFAICLLMPAELLKPEFAKVAKTAKDEDTIIIKLAKMFEVPIFAMAERLRQLELLSFTNYE